MDVMQESFIRYIERYPKETGNISLLYAIARNYFLDYKRKNKKEQILEDDKEDCSKNQEDDLRIKQEYRRVLRAMKRLDDDEREILALVLDGELSYKEIASLVGTTEGNMKVKVHRARIRLKEILQSGDL